MITQLPLFDTGPEPEKARKRVRKMANEEATVENDGADSPVETKAKSAAKKTAVGKSTATKKAKSQKPKPKAKATNGSPKKGKKEEKPAAGAEEWRGKKRLFPKNSIEDSLRVPLALKDKNGGEPMSPEEVAKACGLSAKNSDFYYLVLPQSKLEERSVWVSITLTEVSDEEAASSFWRHREGGHSQAAFGREGSGV